MKSILIVGCGDVATRVIPLLASRYKTYALVRKSADFGKLRALGVIPLLGDLDVRQSLVRIRGLSDIVLHLAPPPNSGVPDTRTRNLLSVLSHGRPPGQLIYISTSGVYGDCGGNWVSESHPLNSSSARSKRRVDAEKQIRGWARRNRVRASILRVPGIYAADRLPLSRLRQGTPAIVESEDSYTNHIHADDLANIIVGVLRYGRACRVYHTCDDSQLKMGEYFDAVADTYGLPRVPRISRGEAQHVLPEALLTFMNESRRLTNLRMKRELHVELRYPTVNDFLAGAGRI
ncbi:MAG: SDR family oxidoreductase [Gallionella sp.]